MKKVRPNSLKALFDEAGLPANIRRGLLFILAGNVFGTMCGYICANSTTSLVGLATSIGASDLDLGIISAVILCSSFFQIPFSLLINAHHHRKLLMLTFGLFSRLCWIAVGIVPYLFPMEEQEMRVLSLILCVSIGCSCGAAINPAWFPWLSDLCPDLIKSRFLAKREALLNILGVCFSLFLGVLLDILPADTKYTIIFVIGGILGAMDMLSYAFVDEVYSAPPKKIQLKAVVRDVLHNKPFLSMVFLWTFWCMSSSMADSYIFKYELYSLHFSNFQATFFTSIIPAFMVALVVSKWGRAVHHFGCRNVYLVCGIASPLCKVFYLLLAPDNLTLSLVCMALRSVFAWIWVGATISTNYAQLAYSPDGMRPSYIAIYSVTANILGNALGAFLGGLFLDFCVNNSLFTGYFDRYKALFLISILVHYAGVIPCALWMPKDSQKTPKDLIRAILNIRPR